MAVAVTALVAAAGRADAGAYLARLVKLDPRAVVRLRPAGPGVVDLWAMLPFGVLVVRRVASRLDTDRTVEAAALLATLAEPAKRSAGVPVRDEAWRWALPPELSRVVETVPAAEILRVAAAASRTLRIAETEGVGGRRVGSRVVREALLDHVPIVVTCADGRVVEVAQRLVQAAVRMGFVPQGIDERITHRETSVTVRLVTTWIGLDCSYGSVWYRPISQLHLS